MTSRLLPRLLVLGLIPFVHGLALGVMAICLSLPPVAGGGVGMLAVLFFAIAGWADLARSLPANLEIHPHHIASFVTREVATLVLPFLLVGFCLLITAPFGAFFGMLSFLLPYAAGLLLGRGAIEQHYFTRPELDPEQEIEAVVYHRERFFE